MKSSNSISQLDDQAQWNATLFSNLCPSDSILPIIFNQKTFGIPLGQVHYVDYPNNLTPLPFSTPQVDGLISFNAQPLLQLNVAQTPNPYAGKVVVIALLQGNIALRIDDVLGFMSTTQGESTDSKEYSQNQNFPLLELESLFPWIKQANQDTAQTQTSEANTTKTPLNHYILLVSSSDKTIAILADSIERIEQIDETLSPRKADGQEDFVVRIENNLFPARSLARLLNAKPCTEKQALMVQNGENTAVLAVEKIFNLEKVNQFHLTTHSEKQSLWHINEKEEIIEVVDAKEFFGKSAQYQDIQIVDTQSRWKNTLELATNLSTEGVKIQCGQIACVLPLSLVNRIIGDLSELNTEIESSKSQSHAHKTPVIDCDKLLNLKENNQQKNYILLSLLDGQALISVDYVTLQATLPAQKWLPLKLLPPSNALFFDAATFDETAKHWVFRVKADIHFNQFSWQIKRLIRNALIGWVESEALEIAQNS